MRADARAKRRTTRLLELAACALAITACAFSAGIASAEGGWTCGTWASDPTGRCEEARSCTRRKCADVDKPDTCVGETRTECVNPSATSQPAPQPMPQPSPPDTGVPSPGGEEVPPSQPPGGSIATPGGAAPGPATTSLTVECTVKGNRIYAVNSMSDRVVPKGTTILWQIFPLGLAGRKRLAEDLLPGQASQLAKVPFALQCTASIVQP